MQTMLERLRELSDDAVTARERADDLKVRAKDAKEFLDSVLAQLQHVAYKLSHGLQDLPFDGEPETVLVTLTPVESDTKPVAAGNPVVDTAPEAVPEPAPEDADLERARLFRRLTDDKGIKGLSFRSVCRWNQDEVGEMLAWLDGGPVRPAFLPESVHVEDPLAVEAEQEPVEPEPEPEAVPQNRRRRKHHEPVLTEDTNNDIPQVP